VVGIIRFFLKTIYMEWWKVRPAHVSARVEAAEDGKMLLWLISSKTAKAKAVSCGVHDNIVEREDGPVTHTMY
jgi:hypothetical protein